MKKILNKFPKDAIGSLPRAVFEGRIITVESEQEAEKAVSYLLSQEILGFDTETKPNFTSGRMNTVALLQVSSRDTCFLFRLNHIGFPDCLVRLLSDNEVLKVGLSWHDDLRMLSHRREFTPGEFVELQTLAAELGTKDMSLQKLYANFMGQKISKSQQLSNWEADVLRDPQKLYAATDAWACIMLYEEFCRMKQEGYTIEVMPSEEPLVTLKPKKKKDENEAPKTERKRKKTSTDDEHGTTKRKTKAKSTSRKKTDDTKPKPKTRRTKKVESPNITSESPKPQEETKKKKHDTQKSGRSKRAKSQVTDNETISKCIKYNVS